MHNANSTVSVPASDGRAGLEPPYTYALAAINLSVLVLCALTLRVFLRTTLVATVLHVLSPAGTLLSAPYSESLFSLLSFLRRTCTSAAPLWSVEQCFVARRGCGVKGYRTQASFSGTFRSDVKGAVAQGRWWAWGLFSRRSFLGGFIAQQWRTARRCSSGVGRRFRVFTFLCRSTFRPLPRFHWGCKAD